MVSSGAPSNRLAKLHLGSMMEVGVKARLMLPIALGMAVSVVEKAR